ncbi:amidohydrolase family protein [Chloroflexota bacterium]
MVTEREEWLRLTIEDPIEPELPICDPHHHLWDRPNDRYLLEEFLQDSGGGHRIVQTVFMEIRLRYREDGPLEMRPVGETEFVQAMTNRSASGEYGMTAVAAGIVGFADLTLGAAVAPVLEAHIAAGKGRFRGVRYTSVWHARKIFRSYRNPPKGLLLDPRFREGFTCLRKYGLSFDAWLNHTQLMELVDLARAFPDIPIILNHIGGPLGVGPYAEKREEVFREWRLRMAALATCPNVTVKLGGFGMPNIGFGWHKRATPPTSAELAEVIAPYYHWCIEQFGADRCMFESNFPVDKMSYSYTVIWNAFKRISKGLSPEERRGLFHDTAARVYRLATNH